MEKVESVKQVFGVILLIVMIVAAFLIAMNQLEQLAQNTATEQARAECQNKWDIPDAISIDGIPHCVITVANYYASGLEVSSRRAANFEKMEKIFGPPRDVSKE